ncbi:MAG: SH3 domain-containing protein [Helicobacteraceae bacterium]|nr:SH3 domain-containing protein [Helicobacteraceae bacterium]
MNNIAIKLFGISILFANIAFGEVKPNIQIEPNFQAESSPQIESQNLESQNNAKLIYIKQELIKENDTSNLNYVGEIIAIKYNVLVLDNAEIRSIGFLESKNVSIKNQNSPWNELEDGSLENIFYFKINSTAFSIPKLEVIAQKGELEERELSQNIANSAINLNAPNYVGVVAKKLEIKNYSIKTYDENNNIIVLDLVAEFGNLENFKIQHIKKQGFEASNFGINKSSGIYYAILPNNILNINLEYFDINTQSYKTLKIKNIVNKEQININQEINPINKALIFKNIVILVISFAFLIMFFIRKLPFKLRLSLFIVAILLIGYLIFTLNSKEGATIKANSNITILPTANSTIITKTTSQMQVQILSEYRNYYKVLISDNKTGWVTKDNVE